MIERTTLRHNTFFEASAAVRTQEIRFETTREMILRVLRQRFKRVSKKVEERLPLIRNQEQLEQPHDLAVSCPDQKALIAAMPPPRPEPEWPPSVTGRQANPPAGS